VCRFANFAEDDENLIVGGSTQGHIVIWNLDKDPSGGVCSVVAHPCVVTSLTWCCAHSLQSNRDSMQDDTTDPSVEHIAAHSQWVRCVIRRGDTLFSCSRYVSGVVVGIACAVGLTDSPTGLPPPQRPYDKDLVALEQGDGAQSHCAHQPGTPFPLLRG
jgi:hypothetical protein